METSLDKIKFDEFHYKAPTESEIMALALAPGQFRGLCKKCHQVIRGITIEEVLNHPCKP